MRPACLGVLLLAALLQLPLAGAQTVIVYSRLDAPQAVRAQRLARLYDQVLIDIDLAPGVPWRPALERGICASDRVLLLWSRRAAASAEVAREIQTALVWHGQRGGVAKLWGRAVPLVDAPELLDLRLVMLEYFPEIGQMELQEATGPRRAMTSAETDAG